MYMNLRANFHIIYILSYNRNLINNSKLELIKKDMDQLNLMKEKIIR